MRGERWLASARHAHHYKTAYARRSAHAGKLARSGRKNGRGLACESAAPEQKQPEIQKRTGRLGRQDGGAAVRQASLPFTKRPERSHFKIPESLLQSPQTESRSARLDRGGLRLLSPAPSSLQ